MGVSADVIVALSTPRGRAALGVVRVSGPAEKVERVVSGVFRSRGKRLERVEQLADRRPHLGEFLGEQGEVLDEGLLLWMRGPRSFTGEDVVELHGHGNPWLLERLVNAVLSAGARAAQPGEFTQRAYLNGRMDLIQADAVAQLIHASSERGLKAAQRLLSGELSERLQALRQRLVEVLKWVEMAIDFPEEDVDPASDERLLELLRRGMEEVEGLLKSYRQGQRARVGVRVVLCGRANVGKSSLFNALLGYRRSLVADVPGTTRDVVDAELELGGVLVKLHDTAGLRESVDVLESEGMGMTREVLGGAELAVWVVDGSRPPTGEDEEVAKVLSRVGVEWVGVKNKRDEGEVVGWEGFEGEWISVSAREREGLEQFREVLTRRLVGEGGEEGLLLTSRWQKEILERLVEHLSGAMRAIEHGMTPEVTAYELYASLDRLDEITGGQGREEVMNRVFADFCLGK